MSEAIGPQLPQQVEISYLLRIYDYILAGVSCNKIAETFNAEGLPTSRKPRKPEKHKKGKWTATTIRKLAENPIYAGIVVTGRKKKEINPLTEQEYTKQIPPEQWVCRVIPDSPYKIIDYEKWIKVQIRLKEIDEKVKKNASGVGRPQGEFGASIISGRMKCWYCGGAMVSGGRQYPRGFRCANRRKRKGNKDRCEYTYTVREDIMVPVLTEISVDIIRKMFDECLRVVNEEFYKAGTQMREEIARKESERVLLLEKRESRIEMATIARKKGYGDLESIVKEACDIDEKIKKIDFNLEQLRNANKIALEPLMVDAQTLKKELEHLQELFNSNQNVPELRTAIKKFLPEMAVLTEELDKHHFRVRIRFDKIPSGISDFLRPEHEYVINRTDQVKRCVEVGEMRERIKSISDLQPMYDYLSHRYLCDNLSYTLRPVVPLYFEILIETPKRCKKGQSTPFIQAFSFPHHDTAEATQEPVQRLEFYQNQPGSDVELEFYPLFKEYGDISPFQIAAAEGLDEILHALESTSSYTRRFALANYSLFDGELHPDGREFIMPEEYMGEAA